MQLATTPQHPFANLSYQEVMAILFPSPDPEPLPWDEAMEESTKLEIVPQSC